MRNTFYQFFLALCSACEFFDLSCNQTHATLSLSPNCGNATSFFDSNFTGLYVSQTKSLSVRPNLPASCKLSSTMDFEFSACFQDHEKNFTAYLVQYLELNGFYVPLMTHEAQELVCEHVTFENYTHPDPVLFNQTAVTLTTTHGVTGKIPFTEDSIPEVSLTTSGGSKLGEKMTLKGVTSFGTSGPGVILVNCTIRMDNRTFQIIENKEITSIGHLLRGEIRCDHAFEFRRFSTSPDTAHTMTFECSVELGPTPRTSLGCCCEFYSGFINRNCIATGELKNGKDIYQCEGSSKKVVWGSKWGMWSGGGYFSLGTSAHDSRCLGDYGEFEGANYVWQNGYQLKLECLIHYPKIY